MDKTLLAGHFLDIAGRVFYCVFDSAGRSSRQAEKARREVELELEAAGRKIEGLEVIVPFVILVPVIILVI